MAIGTLQHHWKFTEEPTTDQVASTNLTLVGDAAFESTLESTAVGGTFLNAVGRRNYRTFDDDPHVGSYSTNATVPATAVHGGSTAKTYSIVFSYNPYNDGSTSDDDCLFLISPTGFSNFDAGLEIVNSTGKLRFHSNAGGTQRGVVLDTTTLTRNASNVYHATIVLPTSGRASGYINAVAESTTNYDTSAFVSTQMSVGGGNTSGGIADKSDASVYDFRIYDGDATAGEVSDLYTELITEPSTGGSKLSSISSSIKSSILRSIS